MITDQREMRSGEDRLDPAQVLADARRIRGAGHWRRARARLRESRTARWSQRFLAVAVLLSLLTPLLPLPSPTALDLRALPRPPVGPWVQVGGNGFRREYWELSAVDSALVDAREALFGRWQTGPYLGTDSKGRDLLSRILWGSRTSLLVALAATACSLLIGVTYGAFAGLIGGRTDRLMMRLVDVLYSLPFVFLVIFVLALLDAWLDEAGGASRELVFYALVGAVTWLTMARVVRGQVLALKNAEFVQAARAMGASNSHIVFRHLVPNLLSVVIVYLTLTIPSILLVEAFLSFLGLGIQPPRVSWGLLAADGVEAINPLHSFWWIVVWPAVAMGSTLLALNLLGDGVRDALDPRGRAGDTDRPAPGPGA
jgi:oligopeptide transport system permease protein